MPECGCELVTYYSVTRIIVIPLPYLRQSEYAALVFNRVCVSYRITDSLNV